MIALFIEILLLFSLPSFPEDRCGDIPRLTVECYREKSRGVTDRCKALMRYGNKFRSIRDKACFYGCISESLYEANMTAETLYAECRKSNTLKGEPKGLK